MIRARVVTGGLVAAAFVARALAGMRWHRGLVDAVSRLHHADRRPGAAQGNAIAAVLPEPVSRYLAFALPEGPTAARGAFLRWRGEFRLRPEARWTPFTAVQHVTLDRPGFVWDAQIRMLPLLTVRVRDGYVGGEGSMRARVAALVPVVDQAGTPELAQSTLARWLGEAVWFPAALARGGPVRWEAIDERHARAVVEDGAVRAEAEFEFAAGGEIVVMRAMRHRDVDGMPVLTPFEGRYGPYEMRGGVRVPAEAEVAWELPEGRFAYWRGRVVEVVYGSGES